MEGEALRLIVHRVDVVENVKPTAPGEVVCVEQGLCVSTGKGVLRLDEIQPAGKRVMQAEDFLRGVAMRVGDRLS